MNHLEAGKEYHRAAMEAFEERRTTAAQFWQARAQAEFLLALAEAVDLQAAYDRGGISVPKP